MTTELKERVVCSDTLPDRVTHSECGCEVTTCCFGCPLVFCKHDQPLRRNWQRNLRVVHFRGEGFRPPWIAHVMGLSLRTVQRILSDDRERQKSVNISLTDVTQTRYDDSSVDRAISSNGRDNGRR